MQQQDQPAAATQHHSSACGRQPSLHSLPPGGSSRAGDKRTQACILLEAAAAAVGASHELLFPTSQANRVPAGCRRLSGVCVCATHHTGDTGLMALTGAGSLVGLYPVSRVGMHKGRELDEPGSRLGGDRHTADYNVLFVLRMPHKTWGVSYPSWPFDKLVTGQHPVAALLKQARQRDTQQLPGGAKSCSTFSHPAGSHQHCRR
jgi:hypothetical protein